VSLDFEFSTATRIIFGKGKFHESIPLFASMGRRAFVIAGSTNSRIIDFLEQLKNLKVDYNTFNVSGEPTVDLLSIAIEQARQRQCDFVVGIGGGSVLDTAKAVAALLANEGELLDYLEIIGGGLPLRKPAVPCIVVPTTSGSGAEVTANSVLTSVKHKVKVSMRSPFILPRLAIVDPQLTYSLSKELTMGTGLDSLTQLLESFTSMKANPLTDAICREGLKCVSRSLLRVYNNGNDVEAREDMSLASLLGGLALANAKLGAVHGIAGPMGGMISAPHGIICASLLPFVIEANIEALDNRDPHSQALNRYREVSKILTSNPSASLEYGIVRIFDLYRKMHVPSLMEIGLKEDQLPELIEKAQRSSSMKGNPILLTSKELLGVCRKAF